MGLDEQMTYGVGGGACESVKDDGRELEERGEALECV